MGRYYFKHNPGYPSESANKTAGMQNRMQTGELLQTRTQIDESRQTRTGTGHT